MMPSIAMNSTGSTAAETLTAAVPGSGNANLIFLNETGSAVNAVIRGSSTNMTGTLISATDETVIEVFAEADRGGDGPVVSGVVPAGGYIIFNVAKSDASAGNVLVMAGDIQARHATAAAVGENVYLSVVS